jgi:hypothetical protein
MGFTFVCIVFVWYIIFKQDKEKRAHLNLGFAPNEKFQNGVMMLYISLLLGPVAIFVISIYLQVNHINGFSGIFFIPIVILSGIFGFTGLTMISHGNYLQDLEKIAIKSDSKEQKKVIKKEITKVKKQSKKNVFIIIAIPIAYILILILFNKFEKYQYTDNKVLIQCKNQGRIVMKNLSKTKVYYTDSILHNPNMYAYDYIGKLEGDKIIVKNQYLDLSEISKCLSDTNNTKYTLIPIKVKK